MDKKNNLKNKRVVCWFSCGATSAVATKLAITKFKNIPIKVVYCDTGSEHKDNKRFLSDCEKWFEQKVIILKSKKYNNIWEVFEQRRWLVSPKGAKCTTEMKKMQRFAFQRIDDLQVWGFDVGEHQRVKKFIINNPEVDLYCPLIEHKLTKANCLSIIERANIEIPAMYKLGYNNNNCIGCVKGGQSYWNKIRIDFPETFNRMAKLERKLNTSILKRKKQKLFLDELDPNAGNPGHEPYMSCDMLCEDIAEEIT